jgi:hypothetical protein
MIARGKRIFFASACLVLLVEMNGSAGARPVTYIGMSIAPVGAESQQVNSGCTSGGAVTVTGAGPGAVSLDYYGQTACTPPALAFKRSATEIDNVAGTPQDYGNVNTCTICTFSFSEGSFPGPPPGSVHQFKYKFEGITDGQLWIPLDYQAFIACHGWLTPDLVCTFRAVFRAQEGHTYHTL